MRTIRCLSLIGLAVALLSSCGTAPDQAANAARSLVVVGGGGVSDEMRAELLSLSPKADPVVLVIPHATQEDNWANRGRQQTEIFSEMGVEHVLVLDLEDPDQALADIEASDVIWMPGGSQERMLRALEEAGVAEAVRRRVQSGVPAGGTSAGAAIMSDVMIANSNRDEETGALVPVMSHGLGFWPEVIVDQHFSERNRLERLERAVELNPELTGIGIDERTAVILRENSFHVMGEGTVTVVNVSDPQAGGPATVTAVLSAGEQYPITTN